MFLVLHTPLGGVRGYLDPLPTDAEMEMLHAVFGRPIICMNTPIVSTTHMSCSADPIVVFNWWFV